MFLNRFERIIFYTLVFLLPSQLGYHFWPDYAFIFGVRVDYLAPTIYLTDILVILLIAISRTKIKNIYLFGILLLALVNILISVSPWVSLWKWLKVFELMFLAKYIFDNFGLVKSRIFQNVLSISLLLTSFLGILQFLTGKTIGGLFYLIGERVFSISTPGIALQTIFGESYLRAYSSFSHPNSLAGYLLIGIIYLFGITKKNFLTKLTFIVSSVCFLVTFSLSAFLASVSPVITKFKYLIIMTILIFSFSLPFVKNTVNYSSEISERITQANIVKNIANENFIFGTGLNTFTMFNHALQPVHNIYLLIFAETGIIGLLLFLYLIFKAIQKKNSSLIMIVLIIGGFDHYFITLQQNILLLAVIFGATFSESKILKSER